MTQTVINKNRRHYWQIMMLSLFCVTVYLIHLVAERGSSQEVHPSPTVFEVKEKQFDLTFWSSDFHISPIADIKNIFSKFGPKVIDKSLSGHCHLSNTCERDLRVINKQNGIRLGSCPNDLIRSFYRSYVNDAEMLSADAIICTHAASMCEIFMAFNKSLVVVASTRYEIGRHEARRWELWNQNLERIAADPNNVVAANNKYDQEYIKYFTSIKDVWLLPSYCGYIKDKYRPTRHAILIAPARGVSGILSEQLLEALGVYNRALEISSTSSTADIMDGAKRNNRVRDTKPEKAKQLRLGHKSSAAPDIAGSSSGSKESGSGSRSAVMPLAFSHIRDLYPQFEYGDLAAHRGIVILPYQISFMSLFEFYRMEIPMFVPSPELLADWHMSYNVLNERTWPSVFGTPVGVSVVPKHPRSASTMRHDPNNDLSREAVLEWIKLADFYVWPHIVQFSSWGELMTLVATADYAHISASMREFNEHQEGEIRASWRAVLDRVEQGRRNKRRRESAAGAVADRSGSGRGALPATADEAIARNYGFALEGGCGIPQ